MKKCAACQNEFPLDNFPKDKTHKCGYRSYCFPCNREKINTHTKKRKEKRKLENKVNKDQISNYNKDYYSKNKEVFQTNYKNYLKTNPQFKIAHNTRVRINKALKNNSKSISTEELLGLTFNEYKIYLEDRFNEYMNWDNYGSYWDIDHIRPCATFDLTNEDEFKICFHHSNTQPLSKKENQTKNKYTY